MKYTADRLIAIQTRYAQGRKMRSSPAALPATVADPGIPTNETDTTGVHPTRELRRAFRRAVLGCWDSRISRSWSQLEHRRSNPGSNKGLRLPQRSDFFVQIAERRFERFAVMAALRGNEVPHHSGPGQLQAFPFALPVQRFLAESRALAVSAPALSQLHLRFDRLAFPTSSHILQSVIPRAYARSRSLFRLCDLIRLFELDAAALRSGQGGGDCHQEHGCCRQGHGRRIAGVLREERFEIRD